MGGWKWREGNACGSCSCSSNTGSQSVDVPLSQGEMFNIYPHVCVRVSCCVPDLSLVVLSGMKVESAMLREFAAVADGPGRGVLLFPEICTMELQLLASGSPDLEVLSHVFHSLLGAVHANPRNAALLYDQVRLTTSSSLYYSFHISCRTLQFVCTLRNTTNFHVMVLIGRSQNYPLWLSPHPRSRRPLLYRFVIFFWIFFNLFWHAQIFFMCDMFFFSACNVSTGSPELKRHIFHINSGNICTWWWRCWDVRHLEKSIT